MHTPLMPFGWAPMHMGERGRGLGRGQRSGPRPTAWCSRTSPAASSTPGFDKVLFCTLHGPNVDICDDVLYGLRYETGAFVSMYGGRESSAVGEIFESPPARLTSDVECSMAMALVGGFESDEYLARSYEITVRPFLGEGFAKTSGMGSTLTFDGGHQHPRRPRRQRVHTPRGRGPARLDGERRARREAARLALGPPGGLRPRGERDEGRGPQARLAPAGALADRSLAGRLLRHGLRHGRSTATLLDQVERADEAGFDSVWLRERHFHRDHQGRNFFSSPMVAAAWIAARTERVRIGLGRADPAARPPDPHRRGRGDRRPDLRRAARPRHRAGSARTTSTRAPSGSTRPRPARGSYEALEVIERAWTRRAVQLFGRALHGARGGGRADARPSGPARRSTSSGISERDARLRRRARACRCCWPAPSPRPRSGARSTAIGEPLDAAGHDPEAVAMPLNRFVYVAETTERARARDGPGDHRLPRPPGIGDPRLPRRARRRRRRGDAVRRGVHLRRRRPLRGADRAPALRAGVGEVLLTFNYFTLPHERCLESMERFIAGCRCPTARVNGSGCPRRPRVGAER